MVQQIDRLFMRMQAIYGHKWSSQWPSRELMEVAKAEWAHDLRHYSGIMGGALNRCKDNYADFPPTLPQFKELCRPNWYEQMPVEKSYEKIAHEKQNVIEEMPEGKKEFVSMLNRLNLKQI